MRLLGGLIVGIMMLTLVRCSGPKVIAFTGNNPDFGSYYTFRVKHPATPEGEKDDKAKQMISKVEKAIKNQLEARDYEYAGVADMVVRYNLILDNKVDYRLDQTGRYNYNNLYYRYPYGNYPYWFERDEYTEGTLLVELREELNNKLIWQASLDMKYNKRSSSKRRKDPVENAFEIIFSEYPYEAGNSRPVLVEEE